MTSVTRRQRWTRDHPCPVCGGYQNAARGNGVRCWGFLSSDESYAHCSREEYAGGLPLHPDSTTYAHRLAGECGCGRQHGPAPTQAQPRRSNDAPARSAATYPYTDERGDLLFEVVRMQPKCFRQRRPDGRGGWLWSLDGVRRVLYRLPGLLAAPVDQPVYVTEGEKDCDALARLGLVATTNPGGAGKWRDEFSAALRGRRVVILPDADEPGRGHAQKVAASLHGVAASVRVVELPGLPPKGDASDWLAAGGDRAALEALVRAAPEWQPISAGDSRFLGSVVGITEKTKKTDFALTSLSDLLAEPVQEVDWLVEGLLPSGGVSIVAAKPKVGKSTLARCLALAVARGDAFLGRATAPGPVVYLALEEKRSKVQEHFTVMGAGREQVYVHVGSAPEQALAALDAAIAAHHPALAIVDPLLKLVRLRDANDYAEVSRAMEPLIDLARGSGCHILCVHHMGKGERTGGDAILGSTALFGAVDSALLMKRGAEGQRTLASIQRYGDDLPETVLALDPDAGLLSAAGDVATIRLQEAGEKVLAALGDETLSEADIRARVGGNESATAHAIRHLLATERLIRTGEGKRGSPFQYSVSRFSHVDHRENRETEKPATRGSGDAQTLDTGEVALLPTATDGPDRRRQSALTPLPSPDDDSEEIVEWTL